MEMRFIDAAPVKGIRRTADGYAVAEVPVARTGVQDYAGYEVGRPDLKVVHVYRPPAEVFADGYIASLAHKAVTDDHPREAVTADNWDGIAKGWTGDTIRKDEANGLVYVPMMLADAKLIDKLEAGKREVSCGYTCSLEWQDGVTPEGAPFHAIQKDLRINHVAVVDRGRAGNVCRVGDSWQPLTDDKEPIVGLKTITHDGVPIEVTDAAEAVIGKLTIARDEALERAAASERNHADTKAIVEAKDGEIAVLKQAVADAAVTPAKLAEMVADRAKLIDAAKALHDADYTVDDANAIRRKAVSAKLGDAAKDMSDAAIEGAFAALKPTTDAFRETVKDGLADADKAITDARKEMLDRLYNPHKADAK